MPKSEPTPPPFGWGASFEQVAALGAVTPPSEVKTRPGKGSSGMLSYVDARFVQDRLDQSVGPMNWQRKHYVDENGNVGCAVGILCAFNGATEPEWVWKSDIGTESNIESIKGQYSDSFKRAAVNWGIARDLYDEKSEARTTATTGSFPGAGGAFAATPPAASPAPAVGLQRAQHGDANPNPEWTCPVHNTRRVVPAGVSRKTQKPYPAFAVCAIDGCDEKPPRQRGRQRVAKPAGTEFVGMTED